jgi:20S proteasome subunit alpha 5
VQAIGVEALTQSVCDLALGFGEGRKEGEDKKMSRPFGVSLLMAGWDRKEGPLLFFSDPSGARLFALLLGLSFNYPPLSDHDARS